METRFQRGDQVTVYMPDLPHIHAQRGEVESYHEPSGMYEVRIIDTGVVMYFHSPELQPRFDRYRDHYFGPVQPVDTSNKEVYDKGMEKENTLEIVKETINKRMTEISLRLEEIQKEQTALTTEHLKLNGALAAIVRAEEGY